jgi:ribosomal protein S18 acetylase RimI-like enzyme
MPDKFTIRQAEAEDYNFLREMLYEAIFVSEDEDKPPVSIIDAPEIYKYISSWMKASDCGFIAEADGLAVGAAWARVFENAEDGGYGFIDSNTPELSLAIFEQYRCRGIGTALMKALMAELKRKGFERLSLSVDKRNRAVGLYEKLGFKLAKEQKTSYLMIKTI